MLSITGLGPSRPHTHDRIAPNPLPRHMGADIYDCLCGSLSRRPIGLVLQRVGIPVRHNSLPDRALHACLQGALAGIAAVPLTAILGTPASAVLCLMLALFFAYNYTAQGGLFSGAAQNGY
jgi:hypothetical protein